MTLILSAGKILAVTVCGSVFYYLNTNVEKDNIIYKIGTGYCDVYFPSFNKI